MARLIKYLFLLLVLLAAPSLSAQQTPEEEGEADNTKYVQVDKTNPDAVVLKEPDRFSDPVAGLDYQDEVEVLDEKKKGAYVKIRVNVGGKWKEGWVRESILGDKKKPKVDSGAAGAEGASSSAQGAKGSVGKEPIDTTGMNDPVRVGNPWEYIDPIASNAKIVSSPLPYHLIIPGALIVGGGALAAILAATSSDPEPVEPDPLPEPEDPEFVLMDDTYTIFCGQTLNIFPLLNDVGTGLTILSITDAPEGIVLLNDSTIFVQPTLNSDASFSIEVGDAVGQMGFSAITITIEAVDITANGEVFETNAGDVVMGNVLQNDLCFGCTVIGVSGNDENLIVQENGDFQYTAPDDFLGEATYQITIENPCGAQDSSNTVFIVNPEPPCSFDWGGNVQVVPADCGLSNGAAFATEELFGPYNFSWNNGVEVPENEDIQPGTYELIVTDTTFGCTDTLIAEVGELPADFDAEANIIAGGCGETDNVQLATNAGPDNVLTVSLSGSTSGIIEDVTDPVILLGDFVELNPGNLIITLTSAEQGADCAQLLEILVDQGPPIPEVIVADVVQPQPPENVGTIVLDLIDAALPADVVVNGEVTTTALAPQVILDGLPPGFYLISVVDFEGCESLPVEVLLEGQGISPLAESINWSPQTMGLTNWINAPAQAIMQTKEGQDFYTPVTNPATIPLYLEWTAGDWKLSGAYGQTLFRHLENGTQSSRSAAYFEFAVGHSQEVVNGHLTFKLGYAEWQTRAAGNDSGLRACFVDGVYGWPIKNPAGQLNIGLRAGFFSRTDRAVVLPRIQWTFGH